jgi:hypothetical protein
LLLGWIEQGTPRTLMPATTIADAGGALSVIAMHDGSGVVIVETDRGRSILDVPVLRDQPQQMPATQFYGVCRTAIALL